MWGLLLSFCNSCAGRYTHRCCPAYLKRSNFDRLKKEDMSHLHVRTAFFSDILKTRKYDKVILMDHVDWLNASDAQVNRVGACSV